MLKAAHKRSLYNHEEIKRSGKVGCFHCIGIFDAADIDEWTDNGRTALCPRCWMDSIIGDASGFKIKRSFLEDIYIAYFTPTRKLSDVLKDFL